MELFDFNNVDTGSSAKVLNELPNSFHDECKLAVIGSHPTYEDVKLHRPFVGAEGRIVRGFLGNAGIATTNIYLGNVCQYHPPNNNLEAFGWTSSQVKEGMEQLKADMSMLRPNAILLLGKNAMRAAGRYESITDWRGTIFRCNDVSSPFFGFKCIGTFDPAQVIKQWNWAPLMRFDIQRARDESSIPELDLPQRTFELELTAEDIIERLDNLKPGKPVSIDLEGGIEQGIKCYSVATSPWSAFIVPFGKFSIEDELRIIEASKRMFANPNIPKVLQHSLYDNFVFSWLWKAPLMNVHWDTMLGGWEIYPELPKALGTQASIYTKEPYYKYERKVGDKRIFYEYCCKDSAVTLEIMERQKECMNPAQRAHFDFNMSLLPALLYMEVKGIKYDVNKAANLHAKTLIKLHEIQSRIDSRRGKACNINSPKQVCEFLYDEMGFPVQHPKEGNKYNRAKRASNVDALLALMKQFNDPILHDIHMFRTIDKIRIALEYQADPDERMRCSYNLVGTDTGRLSCNSSPTGRGANLQTITKKLRVLYRADADYDFAQFDLAGADGWTVAAHCAAHGDPTMLNDYMAGIKPAKVIALMYKYGNEVATWSREKILEEGKPIGSTPDTEWLYFACKRVQHGSNYGLGARTMSLQILKDSDKLLGKPIYLTPAQCTKLQDLYLHGRYLGVNSWQNWVKRQILDKQELSCASGHVRKFFGRKTDNKTYQSALSHEPQANTTYATNLAMARLWNDPGNRRPDGDFWIQPLHQVHDAICVQWPKSRRDWAIQKIYTYFNNELTIAGQSIRIPFDGEYGPSWGELHHGA